MVRTLKIATIVAMSLILIGSSEKAMAGYIPESIGLGESVEKADAIVLCIITSIAADDPKGEGGHVAPATEPISELRETMKLTALQPASKYNFKVVRAIKGSLQGELRIHLSLISADFYYGNAEFKVQPGIYCLLLLSKSGPNDWAPVDETVPLILLGEKVEFAGIAGQEPKPAVIDLMLASLADPGLRRANIYLLRRTQGMEVLRELKKYVSDTDLKVRASVLQCMAFNQDTSAIPLIVSFEKESGESLCANALNDYQTPSAVPMLNAVIDGGSRFARRNAVLALHRIADNSSIPFLMKVMIDDDDPAHVDAFEAYATLHRLIGPAVGAMATRDYFLTHRDAKIKVLEKWAKTHPELVPASKAATTAP